MEFTLDDDQEMLAASAAALARDIAKALPQLNVGAVPAANDDPRLGAIEDAWRQLSDLGFVGLVVPEEHGGGGATLLEAAIVAEALAYELVPVPYAGCAITAATMLHRQDPADERLDHLAAGTHFSVAVDAELRWPARRPQLVAWEWLPSSRVLAASGGRGIVEVPAAGDVATGDLLRHTGSIAAETDVDLADDVDPTALAAARIGLAAELTGLARRAVTVATEHAKQRVQFGHPIGSYQAVQQLLADAHVAAETSRSALYGCAWTAAFDPEQAERAGAVAMAWCGEAAVNAAEIATQVLGGIGATWESEAHLILRASRLLSRAFGGVSAAADVLANQLVAA